jgi:hypothetical protein
MTKTPQQNEGQVERVNRKELLSSIYLQRFVANSRPVILTDLMNGELAPPACSLESFVETYGNVCFRSSDRSFELPHATSALSLKDYVNRVACEPQSRLEPLLPPIPYIFHDVLGNDEIHFDSMHASTSIPIEEKCPPPDFFVTLSQTYPCVAARIALGPSNSHCGLHTHGAAVNMIAFGSKRWFLYPNRVVSRLIRLIFGARVSCPQLFWFIHFHKLAVANDGDITSEFFRTARRLEMVGLYDIPSSETGIEPLLAEDLRGIEVLQKAGEIMYVPDGWGHWILNEDFTLSVVYQLESESSSPPPGILGEGNLWDRATTAGLRYLFLGGKCKMS